MLNMEHLQVANCRSPRLVLRRRSTRSGTFLRGFQGCDRILRSVKGRFWTFIRTFPKHCPEAVKAAIVLGDGHRVVCCKT